MAEPHEPSQDVLDEVVDNRRHLHRHPEVSWAEHETSRFLEDRLRVPVVITDACASGDVSAGARALDTLRFLGDTFLTGVAGFRSAVASG